MSTAADLYLEWERALCEPEIDVVLVASLEAKALELGVDLQEINDAVIAAVWNPDLHPRGRDGKFIETFGYVNVFDFNMGGKRVGQASGHVKEIRPGSQKGNPDIDVELPNGQVVTVKPNQISAGPDIKARVPGDFDTAKSVEEFRGRSDTSVDVEELRERVHRDLKSAFEPGVPTSVANAFGEYQAAERERGSTPLDLIDWVQAGTPKGGDEEQTGGKRYPDIDFSIEDDQRRRKAALITNAPFSDGDRVTVRGPGDYGPEAEYGTIISADEANDLYEIQFDNGGTQSLPKRWLTRSTTAPSTDTNPIGEPVTVEPGELGSKDNPIRTSDPLEAVQALHEGKYVELESIDQVSTLLDELADIANEAKAAGVKAPNYDLCLVTVPDTNLFCAESKGIPRVNMPQFSGVPIPGSPADSFPKNEDGEVDLGAEFVNWLQKQGIGVSETRKTASHLKASQSELVGAKVAGMMKWMEGGTDVANQTIRESAIFSTKDSYVLDGHHRWAAVVGLDAGEGGLDDLDMPIREVDLDIMDALQLANDFVVEMGIPPKAGSGSEVSVT